MSLNGSAETTVYDELHGKISSLSPYALDKTLSKENTAAEGKAVGDALVKKMEYTDIVDNLNSDDIKKVLSARQGSVLKKSVDTLSQSLHSLSDLSSKAIEQVQESANNAQSTADAANELASRASETAVAALPLSGGKLTGSLDMDSHSIKNLPTPTEDGDIVTKAFMENYVTEVFLGGEW